jgi:hypothetical protein
VGKGEGGKHERVAVATRQGTRMDGNSPPRARRCLPSKLGISTSFHKEFG